MSWERVQFHLAFFTLRSFLLFQLVSLSQVEKMTPGALKFIIYRLTSQNIVEWVGGGRKEGESE